MRWGPRVGRPHGRRAAVRAVGASRALSPARSALRARDATAHLPCGSVRRRHAAHHRPHRHLLYEPDRPLGTAGRLRAHAARERLHPDPQRGHHAVRRLCREPRPHESLRDRRGGRGRQPLRLAGSAYAVGYYGGRPFVERYGRYVLLRPHHLALAERWFARYGPLTVFFGRMLPIVRTFISLPAGFGRMPFWKFTLYTVLGCVPWVLLLGYRRRAARQPTGRRSARCCTTLDYAVVVGPRRARRLGCSCAAAAAAGPTPPATPPAERERHAGRPGRPTREPCPPVSRPTPCASLLRRPPPTWAPASTASA